MVTMGVTASKLAEVPALVLLLLLLPFVKRKIGGKN